ncbi:FAD/NAD(P)-binding domain-containing protein [Lanmaoa asiatica]|nr:FAD/NAD(P)-binding domain-containing protein [Lanmaoa asiatica]
MSTDESKLKTVAVLGGSYGGNRAAQVLTAGLPSGWRVVLVDRNSHFSHVYNLPRYTVLPGHEHKAFIPYDNLLSNPTNPASSNPHKRVYGTITSLHPHHIVYTPHSDSVPAPSGSPPVETTEEKILHFDYAIYALGSHLPSPVNLWESRNIDFSSSEAQELPFSDLRRDPQCINHTRPYSGMKQESISRLRSRQQRIEAARQVLVVGGGALGIQFASDIAAVYPRKSVTLLHSRARLLPRFDEALGDEVYQGLQELGVRVIFGERLDMSSLDGDGFGNQERMLVKTLKGREIEADLVVRVLRRLLCTGQIPNTSLLHTMDSRTINPKNGMARVSRTMQILALREKDTTFDEVGLDGFIHSITETSSTLCGTVPPPPVDTLVGLGPAPMLPGASTNEMFVRSEADAFYYPRTLVYPHLFAIGDAVDAFGASKAGHTAYYQGEVAARNVIKLIKGDAGTLQVPFRGLTFTPGVGIMQGDSPGAGSESEGGLELEEYVPSLPMIKVSLGLTKSAYEVAGVVGTKDDGTDDLGAATMWGAYGYRNIDEEGMWM